MSLSRRNLLRGALAAPAAAIVAKAVVTSSVIAANGTSVPGPFTKGNGVFVIGDDSERTEGNIAGTVTPEPSLPPPLSPEPLPEAWTHMLLANRTTFPFVAGLPTRRAADDIPYISIRRGVTHPFVIMGDRDGAQIDYLAMEHHDGAAMVAEYFERAFIWGKRADGDAFDGLATLLPTMARSYERSSDGHANGIFDARTLDPHYPLTDAMDRIGRMFNEVLPLNEYGSPPTNMDMRIVTAPGQVRQYAPPEGLFTHLGAPNGGAWAIDASLFMDGVDTGRPINETLDWGVWNSAPPPVAGHLGTYDKEDGSWYYVSAVGETDRESLAIALGRYQRPTQETTKRLSLHWNAGVGNSYQPKTRFYRIYRNDKEDDVKGAGLIGTAPATWNWPGFIDRDEWVPNTDIAVVFPANGKDLHWEASAPFTKLPLDVTSTTIEFVLYRPMRLVVENADRLFLVKNLPRTEADTPWTTWRPIGNGSFYTPRGHFYERRMHVAPSLIADRD